MSINKMNFYTTNKIKLEIIKTLKKQLKKSKTTNSDSCSLIKSLSSNNLKNKFGKRYQGFKISTNIDKFYFSNNKRVYSLFIISLLCLFVIFLFGCENKQKIQRSVVSGRVTDIYGNPVENAVLTSHRALFEAKTNKSGFYAFTSLDTGTHQIKVEKSGYLPASQTITVANGLEYYNVNFTLHPLPNKIYCSVRYRASDSVIIDVTCDEQMKCKVAYKGENLPLFFTTYSNFANEHTFQIQNLLPNVKYEFYVEGETIDGKIFRSSKNTFRTLHPKDIPGVPNTPNITEIVQTRKGVKISWEYNGNDPLLGFRIYKGIYDEKLKLICDENILFASDTFYYDELASAGIKTRYAVQAVDLDGNISSLSEEVVIFPAGELEGFVTWRKQDSPINIFGDIIVSQYSVLNIEPGVIIKIHNKDLTEKGLNPEKIEFIVHGILNIGHTNYENSEVNNENENGQTNMVTIMSSSSLPSRGDWYGIYYKSLVDYATSTLKNVQIANAIYGLDIRTKNIYLDSCKILFCDKGVQINTLENAVFENLKISNCDVGIICEGNQNLEITKFAIKNCTIGVKLLNNSLTLKNFEIRKTYQIGIILSDRGPTLLRGGIIESNDVGLVLNGNLLDLQFLTINSKYGIKVDSVNKPEIRNNIIVNLFNTNLGIGIEDKFIDRSYPYNNIWGFGIITKNCNQYGGPIINVDPQFIGGDVDNFDYRLKDSSLLKSAADNGSELGAYGYIY